MRPGALALLLLVSGCGAPEPDPKADAGPADAGPDAAEDAAIVVPSTPGAPALPAPPALTPCLEGWREVPDADDPALVVCEPWPEAGPSTCLAAELQLPGRASCERMGPACPTGDFAEDLPADREILYVRPGALDGDGTLARPWGSIAQALAGAPDDSIVALAKGTFAEVVDTSAGVTLWGACTAETVISPAEPDGQRSSVRLSGGARGLRNLTITGPRRGLLLIDLAQGIELSAVEIRDAVGYGLVVAADVGGPISVSGLAVRRIGSSGGIAVGMEVRDYADVTLRDAVFEEAGFLAVSVVEFAHLDADGLVVRGTVSPPGNASGAALYQRDGVVTLEATVLEANADTALWVEDGVLDASNLVVRDTLPNPPGVFGWGLIASSAGTVRLTRARFERCVEVAVVVRGAFLSLIDVLVRDTRPRASGSALGVGVELLDGTAELHRVAIVGSYQAGLQQRDDTVTAASDLLVRSTRATVYDDVEVGAAILVREGRLDLLRARLSDSDVCGLTIAGPGTIVDARDLTIDDSGASRPETAHGQGLCAADGAQVELVRARLEANRTAALDLRDPGTSLTGTDTAIVATLAQPSSGLFGAGALVLDGATLELDRLLLMDNGWLGLIAQGDRSRVELRDLAVQGTTTDVLGAGGVGLAVVGGGHIAADGFDVADNATCGVQVGERAGLSLRRGRIRGHPSGACLPASGLDPAALQDGVFFQDNRTDLDDAARPLPDASAVPRARLP